MLSQGTPMMLGGDEWLRTQYGNNNAYTSASDNEWAWFRWGEWTSENGNNVYRHRMHDFVRQLIRLRKSHPAAFSPEDWGAGAPISWLSPAGAPADGATWGSRAIQVHYGGEDPVVLLINQEPGPVTFNLPGGSWGMVIDTQAYYDRPGRNGEPTGWFDENPDADPFVSRNIRLDDPQPVAGSYTVEPRSMVVLESL
jgi:isoamylase